MTIHLVIPDPHAHYEHDNKRAEYLSKLIIDLKPDVVVNIGDAADMPSLAGYDKGRKSFLGRTYRADILAHEDFEDRLWGPIKRRKKRLPLRIFHEGNHEERITRAINLQPELEGAISFNDLRLEEFYDHVVRYNGNTPGINVVDGICYAHYIVAGVSSRAISSEHQAYTLLAKNFHSCTVGHSHLLDFAIRTDPNGRKIMGLSCGVFQDYDADWAGEVNNLWWRGVVIKRNVENGSYDPEFVSMERLRKEYE